MPFLLFAKDKEGKYLWHNQAVTELANREIIGKTDLELMSPEYAEALRATDRKVWTTGRTSVLKEEVEAPQQGKVSLQVCKFVGELAGQKCVFGVAFVLESKDSKEKRTWEVN